MYNYKNLHFNHYNFWLSPIRKIVIPFRVPIVSNHTTNARLNLLTLEDTRYTNSTFIAKTVSPSQSKFYVFLLPHDSCLCMKSSIITLNISELY